MGVTPFDTCAFAQRIPAVRSASNRCERGLWALNARLAVRHDIAKFWSLELHPQNLG